MRKTSANRTFYPFYVFYTAITTPPVLLRGKSQASELHSPNLDAPGTSPTRKLRSRLHNLQFVSETFCQLNQEPSWMKREKVAAAIAYFTIIKRPEASTLRPVFDSSKR